MTRTKKLIAEAKRLRRQLNYWAEKLPPDIEEINNELDWRSSRLELIWEELEKTKEGREYKKRIEAKHKQDD